MRCAATASRPALSRAPRAPEARSRPSASCEVRRSSTARSRFSVAALDCREAGPGFRLGDACQGMREAGFEVTDRDADAPGAEIEGEHRAGARVMGDG